MYPDWEMYHAQLATERDAAAKQGRNPHPAAAPPRTYPATKPDDVYLG